MPRGLRLPSIHQSSKTHHATEQPRFRVSGLRLDVYAQTASESRPGNGMARWSGSHSSMHVGERDLETVAGHERVEEAAAVAHTAGTAAPAWCITTRRQV